MDYEKLTHRQKITAKRLMNKGLSEYLSIKNAIGDDFTLDETKQLPKTSRKFCSFICKVCNNDSRVQIRKLSGRSNGLAYEPICYKCIMKISCNTELHKTNNSNAQKIAQNKPETKYKQRISQIKRYNKNYDDEKYDRSFNTRNYKKFLKQYCNLCYICGENLSAENVNFHHIENDEQGNKDSSISNMAYLHRGCHTSIHNNERYNENNYNKMKHDCKAKAEKLNSELLKNDIKYMDNYDY